MNDLNLAVIGNNTSCALIGRTGRISFCGLPQFDADPVFCSLLNGDEDTGYWDFAVEDFERAAQKYIENTAIVETLLYDRHGGIVRVTDFMPRGAEARPPVICRIIEPLAGRPKMRVRLRPRFSYGAEAPEVSHDRGMVRYVGQESGLFLSTDLPTAHVVEESVFELTQAYGFRFGAMVPGAAGNGSVLDELDMTLAFWLDFSRNLAAPPEWQEAVIRAAITLKLCAFEETGAVLAALTTSIPESANSGRNWDYRFNWLRDSLFTVGALAKLNHTIVLDDYFDYVMRLIDHADAQGKDLQPLYGLNGQDVITEHEAALLPGYRGMGPVRVGNAAYFQQQNDVWGAAIMALTQSFMDTRVARPGTLEDFKRLEKYGERAAKAYGEPDAGIWEFRTIGRVHTFSAVMCWVACDRLAKIAGALHLEARAEHWRKVADDMREDILKRAWNESMNSFVEPFEGEHLDASLLLLHEVGFIDAQDPRFVGTVAAIEKQLMSQGLLYRYVYEDDFSKPDVAFTVCTFWYIDALAAAGRADEARRHFEWVLTLRNHVGLLSEDLDFETHELWGNYPQAYSMVGLINSALRLSKKWTEVL